VDTKETEIETKATITEMIKEVEEVEEVDTITVITITTTAITAIIITLKSVTVRGTRVEIPKTTKFLT
jgi:hypothetical protein